MNIKNLLLNIIYFNLFFAKVESLFEFQTSNLLRKKLNDIIKLNMKQNNFENLRKIGILLGGDNWKRIALQDDHEYLTNKLIIIINNKIKIKTDSFPQRNLKKKFLLVFLLWLLFSK